MKIAVTGSGGFLCSRMISYYQDRDFDGQERIHFFPLKHHEVMLTDEQELEKFWMSKCPEVLIHCGAVSDTKACQEEPEISYKINVEIPKALARICARYHTKMLFCSSDQVYFEDGVKFQKEHFHREDEVIHPKGIYGQQKFQAEQEILDVCPEAVCLRLSWMYDWNSYLEKEHGTLVSTILQGVRERRAFQYPVYDFRSITNVWEVVKNMESAIALPGGVYNFGSWNDCSTYEIAYQIMQLISADVSLLQENVDAFRECPRNLRMDMGKIEQYGIPFLTTSEGLKRSFNKETI